MANLTRLKMGKGRPPAAEDAPDVIAADPRGEGVTRPLQFRVPESVFQEFSEHAARRFGYAHGAKKQLFLAMWVEWLSQNGKTRI